MSECRHSWAIGFLAVKEGLLSEQEYAAFGASGGEHYGVCRICGLRKQFTVQIVRSAVKNLAEAAW